MLNHQASEVTTLRRTLLTISIGAGLIIFGVLNGIVIDQIRFDGQRSAVLKPYEDALRRRNETLMTLELATNGRHSAFEAQWRRSLQDIDDARQTGNPAHAVVAWREAYGAAVRSGRWDPMIDVGDAALRVGAVPELGEAPEAAARRSYLTALFRARRQGSVDGLVRACQGFAAGRRPRRGLRAPVHRAPGRGGRSGDARLGVLEGR